MILNIVFSMLLAFSFYQQYLFSKKIKEIIGKKCKCNEHEKTKDPYKDWRDPSTGLLKSRKNTMI